MRQRPSSRILVLDEKNRVLLLHFEHKQRAHGHRSYWATPGGAIEKGETLEQAARRELYEETGFRVDNIDKSVWSNRFMFQLEDGELVMAHEHFFVARVSSLLELSRANWTQEEREIISEHKWWSVEELRITTETVFPERLADLVEKI